MCWVCWSVFFSYTAVNVLITAAVRSMCVYISITHFLQCDARQVAAMMVECVFIHHTHTLPAKSVLWISFARREHTNPSMWPLPWKRVISCCRGTTWRTARSKHRTHWHTLLILSVSYRRAHTRTRIHLTVPYVFCFYPVCVCVFLPVHVLLLLLFFNLLHFIVLFKSLYKEKHFLARKNYIIKIGCKYSVCVCVCGTLHIHLIKKG